MQVSGSVLQLVGLLAALQGAWMVAGFGGGLIALGVSAVFVGLALEREH